MNVSTTKASLYEKGSSHKPNASFHRVQACELPSTSRDNSFDFDEEFDFIDHNPSQKQKHLSTVETPTGTSPLSELKQGSKDLSIIGKHKSSKVPRHGNEQRDVFSCQTKEIRSKIKDLE